VKQPQVLSNNLLSPQFRLIVELNLICTEIIGNRYSERLFGLQPHQLYPQKFWENNLTDLTRNENYESRGVNLHCSANYKLNINISALSQSQLSHFHGHIKNKLTLCMIAETHSFISRVLKMISKSLLRSLSTLMFIKHKKCHSMEYEPHTLSLKPFKFFFQLLYWFLQLQKCFIKWYEKERGIKLRIHNGGWHATLNLLGVSSCKMFTFCDVIHETKQKT